MRCARLLPPPRLTVLSAALDDLAKHASHLGFGLLDPGSQRGKNRGVAGPRQQALQVFAGALRPELLADAEPQDLRQVVIEMRRRAQDFGGGLRQRAEPGGVVEELPG